MQLFIILLKSLILQKKNSFKYRNISEALPFLGKEQVQYNLAMTEQTAKCFSNCLLCSLLHFGDLPAIKKWV